MIVEHRLALKQQRTDIVRKPLAATLVGLAVAGYAWPQDTSVEAAKQVFAQYVALEQAYDAGLAELYASEALIKNRRKNPMGDPSEVTIPLSKYKTLLPQQLATSQARGERSTYANVIYTPEGALVRIEALRVSALTKHGAPIRLVVGRAPSGKWLIYEEVSESRQ